ncbi:hypothetical protein NX059_003292 [Plenodomus lindquistii]|nr:hypothetical protein NX059_003292 [Plenodomus lindquistii]
MKPRPILSTLAVRSSPIGMFAHCPSLSITHSRNFAPALSCHTWHGASRRPIQLHTPLESKPNRHASTNTKTSQKSHPYGRAPPPPAKSSKPSPPAKTSQSKSAPPTVPARLQPSKSTTVPTSIAKQRLNPPDFTYPPPIDVPSQKPDQGKIKYYYTVGKAYVSFYKTSISHVRQTLKLAKTLRSKVSDASTTTPGALSTDILSRAERQVIRRSALDRLRLPAFGILLLLLGEWLPLVVVYMTPVIPEACRIPQQVLRDLKGIEKRRAKRLELADMQDRRSLGASALSAHTSVDDMSHAQLARLSAQLDCHARVWDWVFGPPTWVLRGAVKRKAEYLDMDDRLIVRDGGWSALRKEEVERACVERGIDVVGKGEAELRKALGGWRGVGVRI